MEPAGRIEPQPWMAAEPTRAVIRALTAAGDEARFVGGCVRDAVLGRAVHDVDIATPVPPGRVVRLLEAAGLRALPTGLDHGTVTAVTGGRHFEITTLRRDVETDGRHAKVAFTDDWAADAARRDFTINALYCDPDGTLFDPVGGLADLRRGRVRFVGDPDRRIAEDGLRILRFFRFYAHYGRPPIDGAGLAACRDRAGMLDRLSGERVRDELLRLLAAPEPGPVAALMAEAGVLARVLPEAGDERRLAALAAIEAELGERDPLRRLAALLATDGPGAARSAARLRLANRDRDRLVALAEPTEPPIAPDMGDRDRRRALYRWGVGLFRDRVLLAWAAERSPDTAGYRRLLRAADEWRRPELPVRGADVVALGIPPGPEVGRLLARLEGWWEAGDYRADRAAALAELARLAGTRP